MHNKPYKINLLAYILVSSLLLTGTEIFCLSSTAEAESNKEVQVAVDQLRATLTKATYELRASEKSTTANLKAGLLKSLDQLLIALTQMNTTLDKIQDKQERRVDSNQLYCIAFFDTDVSYTFIDNCYLANSPNVRVEKTFNAIQEEGWHLTAVTPTNGNRMLAVYSKYVE